MSLHFLENAVISGTKKRSWDRSKTTYTIRDRSCSVELLWSRERKKEAEIAANEQKIPQKGFDQTPPHIAGEIKFFSDFASATIEIIMLLLTRATLLLPAAQVQSYFITMHLAGVCRCSSLLLLCFAWTHTYIFKNVLCVYSLYACTLHIETKIKIEGRCFSKNTYLAPQKIEGSLSSKRTFHPTTLKAAVYQKKSWFNEN